MAHALRGKTAIVTGAGSGINLAFAQALLLKGCNVVIADLALRPEAQELIRNYNYNSQLAARAYFQRTNVKKWDELRRLFRDAEKRFGDIDIVCPGAGIYEPPFSNFWNHIGQPPSLDYKGYATLDINLTHPIRATQLAISYFLSNSKRSPLSPENPKSIIHISSIAGQATPLLTPIYNATKYAINGFVRSLAPLDSRLGIRVVAVAPGIIRTPLWTDNPEKMKLINDETDAWVTPEYVAEAMVRLVEGGEVAVVEGHGEGPANEQTVTVAGGLILEVTKDRLRVVKQYMDEGPRGAGATAGGAPDVVEGILKRLEAGKGLAKRAKAWNAQRPGTPRSKESPEEDWVDATDEDNTESDGDGRAQAEQRPLKIRKISYVDTSPARTAAFKARFLEGGGEEGGSPPG